VRLYADYITFKGSHDRMYFSHSESEAVRQSVNVKELRYVFDQHKNLDETMCLEITNALFGELWNPEVPVYCLRSEIRKTKQLEDELNKFDWMTKGLNSNLVNLFSFSNFDLQLEPKLLDLFKNFREVAVFCGAGASRVMGIPSWDGLAECAVKWLGKHMHFTNLECEYLRREFKDPKQLLTIFHEYMNLADPEAKKFYFECLMQSKDGQDILKQNFNIYGYLAKLQCLKVTTNVEGEFIRKVQSYYDEANATQINTDSRKITIEPICVPSGKANLEHLKTDTVYHLHGTLDNLDKAVLTTKKYIEAYYNVSLNGEESGTSHVFQFLERLFRDYTVVFIGSSLNEFVILEQLLRSEINRKNNQKLKHYALVPSRQFEAAEFRLQAAYFKTLGIKAIPFYTDHEGYERLHTVLSSWAKEVETARGIHTYKNLQTIRDAL
jgi:hypothetical protein